MTRRHLTASVIALILAAALVIAAVIWSARTTPQRLGVEVRAFSRPATAATTGPDLPAAADGCDAVCERATWERAVWQAAVWDNAVAANRTTDWTNQGGDSANPQVNPTVHGTESGTDVEAIIREVWAGSGLEDWAVSIAWRESRHQPDVVSGEGALGLFQLLGHDDLIAEAAAALGRPADWSDPWVNALAARYLAERSGTCHWQAPNYCS